MKLLLVVSIKKKETVIGCLSVIPCLWFTLYTCLLDLATGQSLTCQVMACLSGYVQNSESSMESDLRVP